MPPKLDRESDTVRTQLVSSAAFIERVNDWRRKQPEIPSKSEAIRILVEHGLDAESRVAKLSPTMQKRLDSLIGPEDVERFVREAIESAIEAHEADMDALDGH